MGLSLHQNAASAVSHPAAIAYVVGISLQWPCRPCTLIQTDLAPELVIYPQLSDLQSPGTIGAERKIERCRTAWLPESTAYQIATGTHKHWRLS